MRLCLDQGVLGFGCAAGGRAAEETRERASRVARTLGESLRRREQGGGCAPAARAEREEVGDGREKYFLSKIGDVFSQSASLKVLEIHFI